MQEAESLLQKLGIRHAPIQAFGEDDKISGLDGRYVCIMDPPGPYYILGCDNEISRDSPNREKIQIIFWRCLQTATKIANLIGWDIEEIKKMPVVGPGSEKIKPVSSAIFVMPLGMRPERILLLQDSISAAP